MRPLNGLEKSPKGIFVFEGPRKALTPNPSRSARAKRRSLTTPEAEARACGGNPERLPPRPQDRERSPVDFRGLRMPSFFILEYRVL